jgi:HEAT repeat protein
MNTLGRIGPAASPACERLIEVLEGNDHWVSVGAAVALGRVGVAGDQVIAGLTRVLQGDEAWRRLNAADALIQLGANVELATRTLAAMILSIAMKPPGDYFSMEEHKVLGPVSDILADMGPLASPAIPYLTDALSRIFSYFKMPAESSYLIRYDPLFYTICKLLGTIGPVAADAAPLLALWLRTGWEDLSWAAAFALSQIGEAGIQELTLALSDKDRDVRIAAAHHLLCYTDRLVGPDALESDALELAGAMNDSDAQVRINAAVTLSEMGPAAQAAAPQLATALKDDEIVDYQVYGTIWTGPVWREAVCALGSLGLSVLPLISELMRDTDYRVRRGACRAVGRMVAPVVRGEITYYEPLGGFRKSAESARPWKPVMRAVVPHLVDALGDENSAVRASAAEALGCLGPAAAEAAAALAQALADPEVAVRREAVWALGTIGPETPGVLAALARALEDPDDNARGRAADVLSKIGTAARETVPGLIRRLGDVDDYVRERAAAALGELGPCAITAIPHLIAALSDFDDYVRGSAVAALGKMGPEAVVAVPDLIAALGDEEAVVRREAAEALGRIGPSAVAAAAPLREALRDQDHAVRLEAGTALRAIMGWDP